MVTCYYCKQRHEIRDEKRISGEESWSLSIRRPAYGDDGVTVRQWDQWRAGHRFLRTLLLSCKSCFEEVRDGP